MIDVFALARSGVLQSLPPEGILPNVRFCESEDDGFLEIEELLGFENAGFLGRLERLILFQDNNQTQIYTNQVQISLYLETEGELLRADDRGRELLGRLRLKRRHLDLMDSFPYDVLNLDFCDSYYRTPHAKLMEMNKVLDKIIEWQGRKPIQSGARTAAEVRRFGMLITCRHDDMSFPVGGYDRLKVLFRENQTNLQGFSEAVASIGVPPDPDQWISSDKYGFFLSVWPKEILGLARRHGWIARIVCYAHYRRQNTYNIATLACEFSRDGSPNAYLEQSIRLLSPASKVQVSDIDRNSASGKALLSDLTEVVQRRNQRARLRNRPELPDP